MNYLGQNGNYDLMKKLNLEKVLRTILLHHPISRAKISTSIGLNKVTVSSCVDYFLEKGIIYEIGTSGTSRGRPPTLIDIDGDAGIIVGIDTDIYFCRFLITDLSGKMLEHFTIPLTEIKPEAFLEIITETIFDLKQKYKHKKLGIVGLGLALAGHYNYQNGIMEFVANLQSWNGFPLRSEMDKLELGVPFFIETIANAGAIGEIHLGKSNFSENLVYINGFWGLGVGVCSNGKIFSGYSGFAGRLGHSTIHMNGRKCSCGNKGCWEAYASFRALYSQLYPNKAITMDSINDIFTRLKENDPEIMSAVHELANYFALGLVNVINAYNPNTICLGGYLTVLGSSFIRNVQDELQQMLPQHFLRNLKIYYSDLGELGVAYGAVSMVRDNFAGTFINSSADMKPTP